MNPFQNPITPGTLYLVGACLVLGYLVGVLWFARWFRRERRGLENDIADLYLSPGQLDAKYGVNRNESPDDRSRDGVERPENSTPPSRP